MLNYKNNDNKRHSKSKVNRINHLILRVKDPRLIKTYKQDKEPITDSLTINAFAIKR